MDGDGVSALAKTVIEVPQVALSLLEKQMPPVEVCFDDRVSQLLVTHCELQLSQIFFWLSPPALEVQPRSLVMIWICIPQPNAGSLICISSDLCSAAMGLWRLMSGHPAGCKQHL